MGGVALIAWSSKRKNGLTMTRKVSKYSVSDLVVYSALAGTGLSLLFMGFIPLLLSESGTVVICERNKAWLVIEIVMVIAVTGLGVVKLGWILMKKSQNGQTR